ncbi:MAG: asparaginase [Melioribacteraceae bacterium]|nr:asparaginase [Melioribacteraceae bacterium]MCF8356709.1 asparaginase [Melioribacteraceae bacterium]MCF8396093.1 asparaginase [Melioribacteraceae bacterium]MCF8421079.1 asparaginase [Melioribacteraceae bacterium]
MKNILIVFTGGTFSMVIDEKTGSAMPHFHGEDLLKMIPQAPDLANIDIYNFGMYPGPHMTPELMLELSQKINAFVEDEKIDGIIVTHGTDTLEETAYLLDLTIKTPKPIVVIGAMKTSSEPDWDGPLNLLDAIHIINNPNSMNMGVLVCLNGEINAASEVTKTHTEDIETFRSLDFGTMGFIDRGNVIFNRTPRKLETLETNSLNSNVDLIKVYAGMDDKFFKFSAESGVDGIVVEAMGVGNVPPKVYDGIEYAVKKNIPIVLVSRCPSGETLSIYGYPGAGKWLHNIGVIFADYLNGQKARIKLMLCLGITNDVNELRDMIEEL